MRSLFIQLTIFACSLTSSFARAEAPSTTWMADLGQHIASGESAVAAGRAAPPVFVRTAQALLARADSESNTAPDDRRRAFDLGLQAFASLPGFEQAKDEGIEWVMDRVKGAAGVPSGLAHVTFVAYCTLIPTMSLFSQMGAARTCAKALEVSALVDAAFEEGAALRALALFQIRAPGIVGGNCKAALATAEKALALAPGYAPNLLVYAKVRYALDGDKAAWEQRLKAIIALADDAFPDRAVHQRRVKADAARRLASGDTKP